MCLCWLSKRRKRFLHSAFWFGTAIPELNNTTAIDHRHRALNARFPGQWFQSETGLHYNWHRHYDPTLGRYTQPDPLGFVDGPSVYAYAGGSLFRWVDPDGRRLPPEQPPQLPPNTEINPKLPPNPTPTQCQSCTICEQRCKEYAESVCHSAGGRWWLFPLNFELTHHCQRETYKNCTLNCFAEAQCTKPSP